MTNVKNHHKNHARLTTRLVMVLIACGSLAVAATLCSPAVAAITVVDQDQYYFSGGGGVVRYATSVTGGEILVVTAEFDGGSGAVGDPGTPGVSASFDGTPLTLVAASFHGGKAGSAIFYLINPPQVNAGPSSGVLEVSWDIDQSNPGLASLTRMALGTVTLDGVDLDNPFGPYASGFNSAGLTVPDVEAGHLAIYSISAAQKLGLGNPPLLINGTEAAQVPGFLDLHNSEVSGTAVLAAVLFQQTSGAVTFSHTNTGRDAAAVAVEINAALPIPEPTSLALMGLGGVALLARRRDQGRGQRSKP